MVRIEEKQTEIRRRVKIDYMVANKRNQFMGLNNKVCRNLKYWCRLHQVWLSENDVKRKRCRNKADFDMIGVHGCGNLERKEVLQNERSAN